MGTRKMKYNATNISELAEEKSVLYRIETATGSLNYIDVATRGKVAETIGGHIGEIPGVTLKVEQFDRIGDARKKRANVVKRTEPKYS